jgi:hypothetical protein
MRLLYSLPALICYLITGHLTGAAAQNISASTASWYVAAGASYQQYAQPETVHSTPATSPYLLQPAQVLVGRRFASGASLEAGFMQSQRAAPATSEIIQTSDDDFYYYSTEAVKAFAVSVLLRKPLLPATTGTRWQLDSRVGLAYMKTSFTQKYYHERTRNQGPAFPVNEERRRLGDLPITLGVGASYRIGHHLQLTADASAHVSWILCIVKIFGTSGSPIGGGGGIGVRYNFTALPSN